MHSEDLDNSDRVMVSADLITVGADNTTLESAVSRLSLEPGVSSVTWELIANDNTDPAPDGPTNRWWQRRRN